MAEPLLPAVLSQLPAVDYAQHRTSQMMRLPPLNIPPFPLDRSYSRDDLPRLRLPAPQSSPIHSSIAPLSIERLRPRRSSGTAIPVADLISDPVTPGSESTSSPGYYLRRSPPRSLPEPLPAYRSGPRRAATGNARAAADELVSCYNSPNDGLYRFSHGAVSPPMSVPITKPPSSVPRAVYTSIPGQQERPAQMTSAFGSSLSAPQVTAPPVLCGTEPKGSLPKFELTIRQQPRAARACGFGERDRRVIDPPPILQLIARDPQGRKVNLDELRYSLNVVHCTLWNENGTDEQTAICQTGRRTTRRLMGQLTASSCVAKDEHDVEGCFYCFPDLSCRTHGRYRLRFVVIHIDPSNMHVGSTAPILTEILSDVFTVFAAKDFPGMQSSSALTRALKLQGCNIQVKKGNDKGMAKKRRMMHDSNDDDDDNAPVAKRHKESP